MNRNELKEFLINDLYKHSSSWVLLVGGIVLAIWSQHAPIAPITEMAVIEVQRMNLVLMAAIVIMLGMQLRDAKNIDEIHGRLNRLEGADDESDAADDD